MTKTISKSLQKSFPLLQLLTKLSNKNRSNVLKDLGNEKIIYNSLQEIAHNTLNGKVQLNKHQKRKIKPYEKVLKNLCCNRNRKCCKKRKKLIIQSGGFLPILIPAIAAILTSLISSK